MTYDKKDIIKFEDLESKLIEYRNELVENFHRFSKLKYSTANPKVFTDKSMHFQAGAWERENK